MDYRLDVLCMHTNKLAHNFASPAFMQAMAALTPSTVMCGYVIVDLYWKQLSCGSRNLPKVPLWPLWAVEETPQAFSTAFKAVSRWHQPQMMVHLDHVANWLMSNPISRSFWVKANILLNLSCRLLPILLSSTEGCTNQMPQTVQR